MSEQYKMEPHSPVGSKLFPWHYCYKCGLIYLKNDFTAWSISKGCNYKEHPGYNQARKRYTKPKWS